MSTLERAAHLLVVVLLVIRLLVVCRLLGIRLLIVGRLIGLGACLWLCRCILVRPLDDTRCDICSLTMHLLVIELCVGLCTPALDLNRLLCCSRLLSFFLLPFAGLSRLPALRFLLCQLLQSLLQYVMRGNEGIRQCTSRGSPSPLGSTSP